MRGWKRSRFSELKNAAGIATNLAVLLRRICEGSLPRSNLTNSDELIAYAPMMGLVLAVASRLRVGNGLRALKRLLHRAPISSILSAALSEGVAAEYIPSHPPYRLPYTFSPTSTSTLVRSSGFHVGSPSHALVSPRYGAL